MITIIKAWVRLTKAHHRTASGWDTSGYGNARYVSVHRREVGSLADVARVVDGLARQPKACVIRGELLPGVNPARCERRFKTEPVTFRDEPRQWLMVDADGVPEPPGADMVSEPEACVEHVLGMLPEPFQDASCFWQASASAGVRPGARLHLWFWLSRPISSAEARGWLRGSPVDRTIYTPIQPHYTADPIFADGSRDPMRRRRGWRHGLGEMVEVPAAIEAVESAPCMPAHLTGAEPDLMELVEALRRSAKARRIWMGERDFADRSSAHFAFGCALAEAGVRDPDTLHGALVALDRRHGRDTDKILRADYAAYTVGAILARAPSEKRRPKRSPVFIEVAVPSLGGVS